MADAALRRRLQELINANNDLNISQVVNAVNYGRPVDQKYVLPGTPVDTGTVNGIYKRFTSDDIVESRKQTITEGLWSGGVGSLTEFHVENAQTGSISGKYYYQVYNYDPDDANVAEFAEPQFSVTYGHISGGGCPSLDADDASTLPTRAVYTQYRNLLLDVDDVKFTIDGSDRDDIYVLAAARARLKEKMDPGNWQLVLSGSAGTTVLIDDSGQRDVDDIGAAGRIYNVVSGNLNTGTDNPVEYHTGSGDFGYFYPDIGIIVLAPAKLTTYVGAELAPTTTTDAYYYNHAKLLTAMQLGEDFQARSLEQISSTHYFVRVKNREFNFSNNPSFFDSDSGDLTNASFFKDPKVFITTVGLYNDSNELLAVGKLSKPVQKSFGLEQLVKVKLDF